MKFLTYLEEVFVGKSIEVERLNYLKRWLVLVLIGLVTSGVMIGAEDVMISSQLIGEENGFLVSLFFVFPVFTVVFFIIKLHAARLRSIGLSPWYLVLFLVPFANSLLQLFLFVLPKGICGPKDYQVS